MSSLLITGAGLVGAQVARLEQQAGRTPVLFDVAPDRLALADFVDLEDCVVARGDLLDPLALIAAIREHSVTRVAHTAAYPNLTAGAQAAPLAAIRVNVLGTANVLEVARIMDIERVVVCSSSALYYMHGGEDHGSNGLEEAWPRPASIYATTKQAAENITLNYAASFDLETICLRFASVFGPWAVGGGGVGTTAMETLLRSALAGEVIEVDSSAREWLYSRDAAQAVHIACWSEKVRSGVFNIGEGIAYSGEELVKALTGIVPVEAKVQAPSGSSPANATLPAMNTRRARETLGFKPHFPLSVALRDYCDWIKSAPSQRVTRGAAL